MTGNLQRFKFGGQTIARATLGENTKNGMLPERNGYGRKENQRKTTGHQNERHPKGNGKTPTVGLEATTTMLRALHSAD